VNATLTLASLQACVCQVGAEIGCGLFRGGRGVGFACEEGEHGLVDVYLERSDGEDVGADVELAAG
jgi:hypothetical protein